LDINQIFSWLLVAAGLVFFYYRLPLAAKAADIYSKLGMNVSVELYAKQFAFIGIMMVAVGFLSITGLIHFL